jgi:tRNA pseudouridine32 synthase/23S rRNA pseudouridine746 synthase
VSAHPALPLPVKDGVAPSYLWLPVGNWPDMLTFLVAHYPQVLESTWLARMARGEVVNGAGTRLAPGSAYQAGMRIFYYRELDAETPIPFDEQILFEDDHLLVVDKPHFLPTIPGGRFLHETLLVRLKKKHGLHDLTPIHRLDRETAGVVIFAKQIASRGAYQSLFQQRTVEKEYEALAPLLPLLHGRTFPYTHRSRMVDGTPFFRMQEVDGEPNSETTIDVIEQRRDVALYRLQPHTGRKHQLRVHMASLGVPIINDAFYPHALPCKQDDMSQPLQLLARAVSFVDPFTNELRRFDSARTLAG